jgi:hypothetical protein
MQVVVVPVEDLHDTRGPTEPGVRTDEDELDAGLNEEVDESLGESAIDVGRRARSALAPVEARIVEIDVEAVLVGGMPRPERAAVRTAQISNADPWSSGVRLGVAIDQAEDEPNEVICAPAAPGPIRPPVKERVPGEEGRTTRWQLDAVHEAPRGGAADHYRFPPAHGGGWPREAALACEGPGEAACGQGERDQAQCPHPRRT